VNRGLSRRHVHMVLRCGTRFKAPSGRKGASTRVLRLSSLPLELPSCVRHEGAGTAQRRVETAASCATLTGVAIEEAMCQGRRKLATTSPPDTLPLPQKQSGVCATSSMASESPLRNFQSTQRGP